MHITHFTHAVLVRKKTSVCAYLDEATKNEFYHLNFFSLFFSPQRYNILATLVIDDHKIFD